MTKIEIEQRENALARCQGICEICGGSIQQYGTPQYAHKIANTALFRKKYGSFVVDHTLNGGYVCSLACNQSMNIGFNTGAVLGLMADIVEYEIRKFSGIEVQDD